MSETKMNWYGPEAATFGDRMAGAREAADMTQAQLARRLGVKKTSLMSWEQDLSEPRANRLSMLSGLLNVSMTWLLTGEGDDLSEPTPEDEANPDIAAVLSELRAVHTEQRGLAERAARLEKSLRRMIGEGKL